MKRPRPLLLAFAVTFCAVAAPRLPARQQKQSPPPPDLTAGDPIPAKAVHDWTLGATGARGWMHCEKMVTTTARQVAITEVAPGSPADGVLAVGDVLLGVGGRAFAVDPRLELGRALTVAESDAGGGRLDLQRWRAGKTEAVTLTLPVLGSYSATAPFDCDKSRRILERGCAALAVRMAAKGYRADPIPRCLDALALLASGDEQYLPLVRREAQWAAGFRTDGFQTWYYGYVCMLLAEYVAATGDQSVLPGLRRLALEAAHGQSAVGSWGHRFAMPDGRLAGYGMMNAPGVPLTIALVMAREIGIAEPAIDRAIARSTDLLRFYVGKGAIPYGDHHPWTETHEDNGKCGMGAVLFDLIGDGDAATFFARMSVASHGNERDTGHTGNYFNVLWAMPAVAMCGPAASGAWMREYGAWYFDLARQWDGTFRHQGPPEPGHDSYHDWDATSAFLLAYAAPLRKLVLTGRRAQPSPVPQLDAAAAEALVADGRGWDNRVRNAHYAALDRDELLRRLGSWSPIVRERAAAALTREKGEVVSALLELLRSPRLEARYGACQALALLRAAAAPAVPALLECLAADDLWLRVEAAEALGHIGAPAMSAVPALLAAMARAPLADDPRGMEQRYLCFTLFDRRDGMLRRSLDGVDREQLFAAIRAGLHNQDGRARSDIGNVYELLAFETIQPLLPAILEATMESAPSGIMFADGVRMAGLRLLARHHLEEGIAACAFYVRHMKQHASEKRVPEVLEILRSYGAHAQAVTDQLLQTAEFFEHEERDFPKQLSRDKAAAVRAAVEAIRADTSRPALRRID